MRGATSEYHIEAVEFGLGFAEFTEFELYLGEREARCDLVEAPILLFAERHTQLSMPPRLVTVTAPQGVLCGDRVVLRPALRKKPISAEGDLSQPPVAGLEFAPVAR